MDDEENYFLIEVGDTVVPYGVKKLKVTDDWVNPPHRENSGELHLGEVENPGIWSRFLFRPVFESGRYKAHCLTTGCVTVTKN